MAQAAEGIMKKPRFRGALENFDIEPQEAK